jgi:hypothetical protein
MENSVDWELFKLLTNVIVSGVTIWFSVRQIIEKYFVLQNQKNDMVDQRFLSMEKRIGKIEAKQDEQDKQNNIEFHEINQSLINIKKAYEISEKRNEESHVLLENMNRNFLQIIDLISLKKQE